MGLLFLLILILINGVFAMSEIAIVSAKKTRLLNLAEQGSVRAKLALELASSPNRFLSTVQIGITFVGVFAGAFGADLLSTPIKSLLTSMMIASWLSEPVSVVLAVVILTFISLVFGEIIPKRIGLINPEVVAMWVAGPMIMLSKSTKPLVDILSKSTDLMLDLVGVKPVIDSGVSEEEVKLLIREGAKMGIFNLAEKDIVERTFKLSDQRVDMLMTPRKDIEWLDMDDSVAKLKKKLITSSYSFLPVCRGRLDRAVGVVRTK